MKVDVSVYSLFCFQGEDNEESEPYLWTIMFAIDGSTIKQNGTKLAGSPQFFFGPGSHGNIGSGTVSGVTQHIPPAIGRWELEMDPITISLLGTTVQIPGVIAVVGRLFEENLTPNSAMEAGHQALNQFAQSTLQDFVDGINLIELAADVQDKISKGMTAQDAAVQVFTEKFAPAKKILQSFAEPVAFEAIAKNLGFWGALGQAIDGDTPIDGMQHFWSMDDLASTENNAPIDFTDRLGTVDRGSSVYNLHGMIWQGINVTWVPAVSTLSPGRYQVTGADFERGEFARWMSHFGGSFTDGSPWRIERAKGVDYINSGQYSFFLHGSDGSEAEVYVEAHDPHVGHPYLKTQPDSSKEDNLVSLPRCVAFVKHIS
jgi:uncharacterized protein DUF3892